MDLFKDDKFLGVPIGKEVSTDALIKDVWDPTKDDIFPEKHFIGVGWGVNFHAILKKLGWNRD